MKWRKNMDKLLKITKKDDGSIVLEIQREDGTRVEIELAAKDAVTLKMGADRTVRPGGVQS